MGSVGGVLVFSTLMMVSACGGGNATDMDCDHTLGFVAVDLTTGEGVYDYGNPVVTVSYPSGHDIDYAVGEDGHLEFEVEQGTYVLQASDDIGGCFTEEPTTIDVEACSTQEVELAMTLCWG